MTDFRSALAAGLGMAKRVELNKKEIDDKFEYLSQMLYEGTSQSVVLVFTENTSHKEAIIGNRVQNVYVVSQRNSDKGTKIGTVVRDESYGYPVSIEAASSKFVCKTAEEIEIAFSEIVQIGAVANAIFSLVDDA